MKCCSLPTTRGPLDNVHSVILLVPPSFWLVLEACSVSLSVRCWSTLARTHPLNCADAQIRMPARITGSANATSFFKTPVPLDSILSVSETALEYSLVCLTVRVLER